LRDNEVQQLGGPVDRVLLRVTHHV
jgi:hypothetical protein